MFSIARWCSCSLLLLTISLNAQNAAPDKQTTSIGDALRRPGNEPVHLLYIHGIGATEPYDSSDLRVSICKQLKDCIVMGGVAKGREYADQGVFDPTSDKVPDLSYMGRPLWRNKEEWMASAPFVDHYVIPLKRGKSILLDEINWWPMVFSLKCRNMLPNETNLAGHDAMYLPLCAASRPHKSDGVADRWDSYAWISESDAARWQATENHAVLLNRKLKINLMDWRFSDALLGVGPLETYIVEGVRQLLMKSISKGSLTTAQITERAPDLLDPAAEYIVISHSLGSFLIFSALHLEYEPPGGNVDATDPERQRVFNYLLGHLTQAYFFANQIPLLELARLSTHEDSKSFFDLKNWADQRRAAVAQTGPTKGPLVEIVAWSDVNDQLTWFLGDDFKEWQANGNGVEVVNRVVKNAPHWFGLFEGPTSAHDNYAKNKVVIRSLLTPLQP